MNTYIICNKVNATDTDGYLFLLSKGSAKNRVKKALGIKVNYKQFKDNWNKTEQRYMSGMPKYKDLNTELRKAITDKQNVVEKETEKKLITPKDNNSFLKFWDRQLELITNQGTKAKHTAIKIKLEKYLTSINKKDLLFSDITPDFVENLQHHFKTVKNPESLSENSVTHYLKVINSCMQPN